MVKDVLWALFGLGLLSAVGGFMYAFISRAESLLQRWAETNGYELCHKEPKLLFKGPFFWSTKSQAVYRVTVRDPEGNQRNGWVLLGTILQGVFGDKAQVRWDD